MFSPHTSDWFYGGPPDSPDRPLIVFMPDDMKRNSVMIFFDSHLVWTMDKGSLTKDGVREMVPWIDQASRWESLDKNKETIVQLMRISAREFARR